jgi:hypothetical protein
VTLFQRWDETFGCWVKNLPKKDSYLFDELQSDHPINDLSREMQFLIEDVLSEIIDNSKIKSGDYIVSEMFIEPNSDTSQLCISKSNQFGTSIKFCIYPDCFSLTSTFNNVNAIPAQNDEWWVLLISLFDRYECKFFDSNSYSDYGNRSIKRIIEKLSSIESIDDSHDFGALCVTCENVQDLKAIISDGSKIFHALNKLNHMLYRTNYTREKRAISKHITKT